MTATPPSSPVNGNGNGNGLGHAHRAAPRCTIGLLTWNGGEDVLRCVASVFAQTETVRIGWVDNASSDGTVERLRERYPDLPEPVRLPSNHGFCVPHNAMIAQCGTRYYLALNQDVELASDYVERLCDWMDARPEVGLAMGLVLMPQAGRSADDLARALRAWPPAAADPMPIVHSRGLVFPRVRRQFQLGMNRTPAPEDLRARRLPGVDGAAMMLRVDACRAAGLPEGEVFPSEFFAYFEEVDLAHRLARLGCCCGIEPAAVAVHRGKGSGGYAQPAIRARFFANHWLVTLRHDPWWLIVRELPWLLRGELAHWLPEYARRPRAFLLALGLLARGWIAARRFRRAFELRHGPTAGRVMQLRTAARVLLEEREGESATGEHR